MPLSTETATARRLPRHSPRRTSCAASQGRWPFTSTRWSTSPTARTCATPFIGKGRQSLLGPLPADRSPEEAWEDAVHPDDRDSVEFASQRLERDEPAEVEYRLVGHDGRTRWVWDRMRPRRTPDGRLLADGIVADISERKAAAEALEAAQRELHHIAFHDALTGRPNRVAFQEALSAAVDRCPGERCAVGVLFVDVDNFKLVNDSFGHSAGDELLCAIADRLRSATRTGDVVARQGGDEFLILADLEPARGDVLTHARKAAEVVAKKIRRTLRTLPGRCVRQRD